MDYDLRDQRGRLKRLDVPTELNWRPLVKARSAYLVALGKSRELGQETERLAVELAAAEKADLRDLGRALAADRAQPVEAAPKVKAKLEAMWRNLAALDLELERLAEIVVDTVEANRAEWVADARKAESEAERAYLAAVDALEAARLRLSERQNVQRWVAQWPEHRGGLKPGALGSLWALTGLNGEPTPLAAVLDALRSELDPPRSTTARGATHVVAA